MPQPPHDTIRPFLIPTTAPEQPFLSQYSLAANTPIIITPGFGATGSGQLPPIQTGTSRTDLRTSNYCTAAQSETTFSE